MVAICSSWKDTWSDKLLVTMRLEVERHSRRTRLDRCFQLARLETEFQLTDHRTRWQCCSKPEKQETERHPGGFPRVSFNPLSSGCYSGWKSARKEHAMFHQDNLEDCHKRWYNSVANNEIPMCLVPVSFLFSCGCNIAFGNLIRPCCLKLLRSSRNLELFRQSIDLLTFGPLSLTYFKISKAFIPVEFEVQPTEVWTSKADEVFTFPILLYNGNLWINFYSAQSPRNRKTAQALRCLGTYIVKNSTDFIITMEDSCGDFEYYDSGELEMPIFPYETVTYTAITTESRDLSGGLKLGIWVGNIPYWRVVVDAPLDSFFWFHATIILLISLSQLVGSNATRPPGK